MTATTTQSLITDGLATFGTSMLAVLAGVLGIGIGYLVFRIGWRKLKGSLN